MLCKNKVSSSDSIQKSNETTNKMLMKGTWVSKSITRWTPFKSIQRRKRQLEKEIITTITTYYYYFFTKHKGKQKPHLKENYGCMGFELEGKKCYLESAFNLV